MIWIVVGIVVLLLIAAVFLYNRLVSLRNRVENAWAQVDVQLKRRYDLIPNLVETVKGYAAHERETFEAVTAARTRAQQAQGPAEQGAAEGILARRSAGSSPSPRRIRSCRRTRTSASSRRSSRRPRTGLRSRARSTTTPSSPTTPRSSRSRATSSPGRSASRGRSSSRWRTRPGRRHASRSSASRCWRRSRSPGTPPPSRSPSRAADVVVQVARDGGLVVAEKSPSRSTATSAAAIATSRSARVRASTRSRSPRGTSPTVPAGARSSGCSRGRDVRDEQPTTEPGSSGTTRLERGAHVPNRVPAARRRGRLRRRRRRQPAGVGRRMGGPRSGS